MTKAQWLFEYTALLEREKEDRKFQLKAFKNILVSILGLDIPNKMKGDEDPEAYTPLVMMAGNHHLLKAMIDNINKDKDDGDPARSSKVGDTEYEAQLARMEAGMEPMEDDPFAGIPLKELLNKRDAQILGVQETDDIVPLPADSERVDVEPVKPIPKPRLVQPPVDSFDLSLLDKEGKPHSRPKPRPLVQEE